MAYKYLEEVFVTFAYRLYRDVHTLGRTDMLSALHALNA